MVKHIRKVNLVPPFPTPREATINDYLLSYKDRSSYRPALIAILAGINIFHFNFYEVGNTLIHAGDKGPYLSAVSWCKPETLCPKMRAPSRVFILASE